MSQPNKLRPGAWVAIATAIAIAVLAATGAFGQDRMVAERLGEPGGQTVVFVPGLGTPGEVFLPTVEAIDGVDAHLVTLAGFGGQPALDPSEGVIVPGAEAIASYLSAQGLTDVVLVGHSLGGQISLQVAARVPDRVAHVLVVDSLPFFAAIFDPTTDPQATAARGEAMATQMVGMDRDQFLAMIAQGAPIQATSPDHQSQVVAYVASSDQATVAQATYEALSLDWRPGLEGLTVPVSVLAPHNAFLGMSPEVLAGRYADQYSALANLEVRVITESRHFIMLDQPDAFYAEVTRVLEGS